MTGKYAHNLSSDSESNGNMIDKIAALNNWLFNICSSCGLAADVSIFNGSATSACVWNIETKPLQFLTKYLVQLVFRWVMLCYYRAICVNFQLLFTFPCPRSAFSYWVGWKIATYGLLPYNSRQSWMAAWLFILGFPFCHSLSPFSSSPISACPFLGHLYQPTSIIEFIKVWNDITQPCNTITDKKEPTRISFIVSAHTVSAQRVRSSRYERASWREKMRWKVKENCTDCQKD